MGYELKIRRNELLLIVLFTIVCYFSFNPVVFDSHSNKVADHIHNFEAGDSIGFLSGFNLEEGRIKVVLIIKDKSELIKDFPRGKVFYLDNIETLKEMQEKCLFIVTKSDIATVENQVIVYKNNRIIYESNFVLDDNIQGIQNSRYGWMLSKNTNFAFYLKQFERSYWPIFIK